jgi:hypothetical protein
LFQVFIPTLWFFALMVNPTIASLIGTAWCFFRLCYGFSYIANPTSRSASFFFSVTCLVALPASFIVFCAAPLFPKYCPTPSPSPLFVCSIAFLVPAFLCQTFLLVSSFGFTAYQFYKTF